jgi:uncharacterized protein YneF (UPF0154 family)
MITKKELLKSKFKNLISIGLLVIGFIAGLFVAYSYYQPKLAYQEKTAQVWASEANKNQKQVDWLNKFISKLDPNPLLATPTPTTNNIGSFQQNNSNFPPGTVCTAIVNAYLKVGWSRTQINQMFKSTNPECSY